MSSALAVFLKQPRPGAVKTRLVPGLGAELAAALYRAMTEETLRRTAPGRYRRQLFYAPPEAGAEIAAWLPGERCTPQSGGSLGERMARAFDEVFGEGARRVVLIGTDLPWIDRERIEAALGALESSDLVLGPSDDGGYYLVGLRSRRPALFEGVAWSTPLVYPTTLDRARALGLRVRSLALERDIDTLEDVRASWPRLRGVLGGASLAEAVERRLQS